MTITRRLAPVLLTVLLCSAVTPVAISIGAQQPEQQEEFVPIDQLPPQDVLPAAPLLIGAYVFVPVVLFVYLVSLARKMAGVQREIERLETELKRSA